MITNNFVQRHNGPRPTDVEKMLEIIGVSSLDQLIQETIPENIRLKQGLSIGAGLNEYEFLQHLQEVAAKNKIFKSFIGMGYYASITPGVIVRNILENPGWYTSYTPYQAEISQGRLEALLNFQTMVCDLTAMEIANASLLDEATAGAEAMIMLYNTRSREQVKNNCHHFFVASDVFPQTLAVIQTRALPLGIQVVVDLPENFRPSSEYFGALLQYPNAHGLIRDYRDFVAAAHEKSVLVAVAADILSLCLLTPPGEWGADIVFGSTQRFGIPMGFGGPHAAYFATRESYKRNMPGRIIGVSVDANGNRALRMALQTREQHIKREKATSNICTAQALLATMAAMYAAYHGPRGLFNIARHINILSAVLASECTQYGYRQQNSDFFDTLCIEIPDGISIDAIVQEAENRAMNFRVIDEKTLGISVDETTRLQDINTILSILAQIAGKEFREFVCQPEECNKMTTFSSPFNRTSPYLTQTVFNTYHSETDMMRYLKKLENKDLSLNRSMIPLGSCTMKLNAAAEMFALSWPAFGAIHPFVPQNQAAGYHEMIQSLEKMLCDITGFAAFSFQPNSGAAGEYAGLMVIREYHIKRGEPHRNVVLIPASAHGTNPASAAMAGMQIEVVKCDALGNIDLDDIRLKAEQHRDNLSCLMVTYPSTHGVFEESILDICSLIHRYGGQVYMDGANMNAQVGLTSPGFIGADVCHLNLHKTFAIPHGGGGPGVGPIGVAAHLVEYLPSHPVISIGTTNSVSAIAAAPYGSALVLTISYAYIKMAGGAGLTEATRYAILNANYIKSRLEKHYKILYTGSQGRCAHEMILDCNDFSLKANIAVIDIAKRLMDYGFHAPTVAFPVHGTLMVEPTESEPLSEMDRFCDAMIAIREEIAEIEQGIADKEINVIKKAPHTVEMLSDDRWDLPYSRKKAAYPLESIKENKYWCPVTRIDDAFGDRNLMCTCDPVM